MKKKLLNYTGWMFLGFLLFVAAIGITYLMNPKYVEKKAMYIFYPTVNITEEYKGKIVVEVPEVYELMQIASSLTETFQNDPNLLRKNQSYYDDVNKNFKDFQNHELVLNLNDYFEGKPFNQSLHLIRLLSLNYKIDDNNNLSSQQFFNINPLTEFYLNINVFLMSENIDLIDDFAKKTDFKSFYKNHKDYYEKLIGNYHKLCDFEAAKNWLENKFPFKYQSYRVVFSPLTGGLHSSMRFKSEDNSTSQAFMFLSAPYEDIDSLSPSRFEIASSSKTRSFFTEIDHNFVNPLTDQYLGELDEAMSDYSLWNGQGGYQSNYRTFNEYMTWGVFNLYALDTYSKENIDKIIKRETDFITDRRKFIRFREFNQELIRLYESKNKPKIEELYEPIFDWIKRSLCPNR